MAKIIMVGLLGSLFAVRSFASVTYDVESQPGDLIVRVETGSEIFDASKIIQGVTNIIKSGAGTLLVNVDLSSYEGAITIEEGRYKFTTAASLGSTSSASGRVRVCANATLESAVEFGTGFVDAKRYDGGPVGRRIEFEGVGCDGCGALQSTAKNYASPFGTNLVMRGDATWGVSATTSLQNPTLAMNGYVLTVSSIGATKREIYFRAPRFVGIVGRIDVPFLDLYLYKFGTGNVGGDSSNVLKIDTRSWLGTGGFDYNIDWTLDMWGSIFCTSGSQPNYNDWKGPVILHGLCEVSAYNNNSYCFTASGPVSGDGGFYLHGQAGNIRNNPQLKLMNANNSFTGGFCGQYGTLHLYDNGALPADGGLLAMTNGTVRLETNRWFSLPPATFDGAGAVYGAYGEWKNSLVKTGEGILQYESCIGSPRLEVKGGKIVLPSRNTAVSGLNYGYSLYNEPSSWALRNAFLNGHNSFTNELVFSTQLCYKRAANLGVNEWENGWHTNMYVTYTGYLWNRSGSNETWTIAFNNMDPSSLYIDGNKIFETDSTTKVYFRNVSLSDGPHAIELRIVTNSDKWAGPNLGNQLTASDGLEGTPEWTSNFGFAFDRRGRGSLKASDYESFVDPEDGSLLTRTVPGGSAETPEGQVVDYQVSFPTVAAVAGGTVEFADPVCYSVEKAEGWPSFEKCDLTIRDGWRLDALDIVGHQMHVSGKLTFGTSAKIELDNPEAYVKGAANQNCICRAEGGIEGTPAFDPCSRWKLVKSADGKSLFLEKQPKGLRLIFR